MKVYSPTPPLLIILSSPSGGGKTTFCQKILQDFPDKITLSISATTRQPRPQEIHGKDYFFLTQEEFQTKLKQDEFAEWAHVHSNYYGTLHLTIQTAFQKNQSVLLPIDVQGALQLKQSYPKHCLLFFILPPSLAELERRLRNRETNSEESIRLRMKNAEEEMKHIHLFPYVIQNDILEKAYQELKGVLISHLNFNA